MVLSVLPRIICRLLAGGNSSCGKNLLHAARLKADFHQSMNWCYVKVENSGCHKPFCSVCIALLGRVTLQNSSSRGRLTLQPACL